MSQSEGMEPNPDLYRQMAAPYPSDDEAKEAMRAFLADVTKLREQHRIAEVALIAGVYSGGQTLAMTLALGDHAEMPRMSYALYRETLETVAKIREAQAASIRASLAETDPEHGEPIPP